jgi:prevent-host-death family protein
VTLKIGVKELRTELSLIVDRVEAGETIEVCRCGRVVAMLVPARPDPWEQMIACGRILPPTLAGDPVGDAPIAYGSHAAQQLQANRGDAKPQ